MSYHRYRIRGPHFPDFKTVASRGFRVYEFGALFGAHIKVPHNVQVDGYAVMREYDLGTLNPDPDGLITKVEWDAYTWDTPVNSGHTKPDPDADPKPTWDELLGWVAENEIFRLYFAAEGYPEEDPGPIGAVNTTEIRARLTDTSLDHGGETLHVGGGVNHMTGLIHMLENNNNAGKVLPVVIMRDKDGKAVKFHTQAEVRPFVEALTDRENRVESAHNDILGEYVKLAAVRDDFSRPHDDRMKAGRQALDFAENYEAKLAKAIEDYDPHELPDDLPTLRRKLINMLEAGALERVQSFKRALSQQGVILDSACDDEADATRKVARLCRQWSTAIWAAETTDAAKLAFRDGRAKIDAVTPINVPVFASDVQGRVIMITASNPSGTAAEGLVAIYPGWEISDAHGQPANVTATRSPANVLMVTVPDTIPLPVTIDLKARNDCGDADYRTVLEAS